MQDSDTITLYEKCIHGRLMPHFVPANSTWPSVRCPGGRERTFVRWGRPVDLTPELWVEVSDE